MMQNCVHCKKQRPVFLGLGDFIPCKPCWSVWRKTVS